MLFRSEDGSCPGGAMIPGIASSKNALTGHTATLPDVGITAPPRLLGRNTEDCLSSGSVYGHAGMIDGLLSAMEEEQGPFRSVVLTGRFSGMLLPYLRHPAVSDRDLTLRGLYYILEEQQRCSR